MKILICVVVLLHGVDLWAQFDKDSFSEDDFEPEETMEQKFIRSNISVTEWFDGTAEGLDLFLVGKKDSTLKNNTHLKIGNSTFAMDGEGAKNTTSLNMELRLPNLEEYWQLKFSSYDEAEEKRGVQNGYLRNTPRETNYGASIGLFRKLGNVRTSFQPRVELTDPLKVSHSLTFESVADFKTYEVNPKLEFFATPDKGTGVYTALNLNFILTKIFSFTLINNWEYLEKIHTLSAANGFSLGQTIDKKSSVAYSLIFFSNNRDNYHLEGYSFAAAFSHLIYKRILDFQVIPHLDFMKDKSFLGRPGVIFNLNLSF